MPKTIALLSSTSNLHLYRCIHTDWAAIFLQILLKMMFPAIGDGLFAPNPFHSDKLGV